MVVNAAGAWAPKVAGMFGQTLHLRPERHEAVMVLLDHPLDYTMPMVMDLVNGEGTGLNFRHEKPGALIAEIHKVAPARAEDPDAYDDQCDEGSKVRLAELLLERLPLLPEARLGRGWAGLYPKRLITGPLWGRSTLPSRPSSPLAAPAVTAFNWRRSLARWRPTGPCAAHLSPRREWKVWPRPRPAMSRHNRIASAKRLRV